MIAQEQTRKGDKFFKKKSNSYTRVLDRLQTVQTARDPNQRVDRIWERFVEIVLFNRTRAHRQPGQVLKAFIKSESSTDTGEVTSVEQGKLRRCFNFLDRCYAETHLGTTRMARDLPHFYTMVTTLLASNLLDADGAPPAYPKLQKKLVAFAKLIESPDSLSKDSDLAPSLQAYKDAAARQTTHPSRRKMRQDRLLELLGNL
jgi:hypothetical protein